MRTQRYEAERTLDAFASRLRDALALDAFERELVGAVRETIQPAHVRRWLKEGPR